MKNGTLIASLAVAIAAGMTTQSMAAGADMPGGPHGPRHSFEELDANGDGQLTRAEMAAHSLERFSEADANGDGRLTREEMSDRIAAEQGKRRDRMVTWMFSRRDANGDGALSLEEMRDGRGERMFTEFDANADGMLSREEFAAIRAEHGNRHGMRQ